MKFKISNASFVKYFAVTCCCFRFLNIFSDIESAIRVINNKKVNNDKM